MPTSSFQRNRWILPFCIVFLAAKCSVSYANFITPSSSTDVMTRHATLTVTQTCPDEFACRRDFNSSTCVIERVCHEETSCNGREGDPPEERPLASWAPRSRADEGCVVSDATPQPQLPIVHFGAAELSLLVNGTATNSLSPCYIQRNESLGDQFTLGLWFRAACQNCSMLEMPQTAKDSLHFRAVGNSVCLNEECHSYQLRSGEAWLHLTIRVAGGSLRVYVGKDIPYFTDALTQHVAINNIYVGSEEVAGITDAFQLYDVRFFTVALSETEINVLSDGLGAPVTYPQCKCPTDFPEFYTDTDFCTDDSSTYVPRFNRTVQFNSPEVIIAQRNDASWASADSGIITLDLNLGISYQIESVEVDFVSDVPHQASVTFLSGSVRKTSHLMDCSASLNSCRITMPPLQSDATKSEFEEQIGDMISITIQRRDSNDIRSFIIRKIVVTKRCDCNGNAQTCTYDSNGYTCLCDAVSHSEDPHCRSCSANYYRSADQFACTMSCQCNAAGVTDPNNLCQEIGGDCVCKSNVDGPNCDQCKPLTYGLSANNIDGCLNCDCHGSGTVSCNNETGVCECTANTAGPRCDRCAVDHFGLGTSLGCRPCNCFTLGTGGVTSCDNSGQCSCTANVQGLKCDSCENGFYGLHGGQGCSPCACNSVGSESQTCDIANGQCPCRGGDITDRICTPEITSIDPAFGPRVGGTTITVYGHLLGTPDLDLNAFFGSAPLTVVSRNDSMLVLRTQNLTDAATSAQSLSLRWNVAGTLSFPSAAFELRPNPTVDSSISRNIQAEASGGCPIYFDGTHLSSVKYPKLQISSAANPLQTVTVACQHQGERVRCITPDLGVLGVSTGEALPLTLMLDGVTYANIGTLQIQPSPVVNDHGRIRFQYPFETTITLHGSNLITKCPRRRVIVHIGVVSCAIRHHSETHIECKPPRSAPGDTDKFPINVTIGNESRQVGTLDYLEFYETTVFIIVICCIGGIILIAIGVIIICCCRRVRNRNKSSNINGSKDPDTKGLVPDQPRSKNQYAELTTLVDAESAPAVASSNGFNSLVRVEKLKKEPKKGIVNSIAEEQTLMEEFLPKVEEGNREAIRQCYIGGGHFVTGRKCMARGNKAQLVDGFLQSNGTAKQKLSIKSVLKPVTDSPTMPTWAHIAIAECLRFKKYTSDHVLTILGIGVEGQRFHILYPFMAQGILKAIVSDTTKDFSVRQLLGFSQQVAEAIMFLTSKDITHKDVAARNCLVDEVSMVKLGDAAFSWDFYPDEYVYDEARERYLPVRWMAPESLSDGYYDMRTDVWSFAIMVWELLTRGCLPFHEVTDTAEVTEYIRQGYILGKPEFLSDDVYDLLRACWSPENDLRPSITSVSKTLSDILDADDAGTYANASELESYASQRAKGMAASPRHHAGGNIYSTTNLSKV